MQRGAVTPNKTKEKQKKEAHKIKKNKKMISIEGELMHSGIELIAMSRYTQIANGPNRRDGLQPEHASAQVRG